MLQLRRVHTLLTLLVVALALTATTFATAQTATKEYKTQPSFLYAFDTDPKANYAGGYLQSNGSSFEYTAGAGSHTGVLSFDGWQDYLDFSKFYDDNNNVLGTTMLGGEMSFEVWACWTTLDYWSRIFDFAGAAGANDNNIFLSNQWSTSTLVFETYVGSSNTALYYSGGVSLYAWQHIVATITKNPSTTSANNAAILALYVNGVQVANTTGYLPTVMARPKSWLGRSNWESSGDVRFRGLFDDFFVYNYSLSTEAITAHYVVPRIPVFELTFAVDPRINMNLVGNSLATYDWVSYDSTDSATNQYAHRGLLKLSSASSQYLDVSGDNGYSEVGTDMPMIGGSGWSTADNDTQGWTFELAFKLSAVTSGSCLFDIGNPSSTSGQAADDRVALCINGPALTLEVSNSATGSRVARNVQNNMFANRWYHVIVMVQPFDSVGQVGRYEAYVNGNYANSTNSGAWLRSVARSRAYIGRSSVSTAPYIDALIDNIRVFDYALTAAEVRAVYRAVTFNTTTAATSFWTSAPSISHTFDVSVPWSERNGGTTLGWTSSYLGRAGIVSFTQANSEWINLLTLPDRSYNLFPGYIGGRSISFEFWVMWTVFGAYCHLMDLSAVASSGGIYLDDIVISTLEQTDSTAGATLKFSLESGSGGVTDATVTVPNAVYLNRWHHLVATIDVDRSMNLTAARSATLLLYVDGALVGNTSSIAPRYVNRPDSWISKGRNSWDTYMGGYLDAFHYYDYEVELEQVRVHYVVPRPPLFELVWSERPFEMPGLDWTTNYGWASTDTTYSSAAGQSNHQGLLQLKSASSNYIDLTVAMSTSSMGTILPQLATLPSFSTLGQSYEFPDAAGQPGRRTGMTIEVSFLYTSETGANAKIFSCGVSSDPSPVDLIELGFTSGSRDLIFSASNSDTGRSNTTTVISNAFYQKWFHVVIVMRTTGQRNAVGSWQVYVNGVAGGVLQNTAFPYSTPRDVCALGRSASGASDSYFNGYIDSFRVFDYALNTTEVGRVYSAINQVTDSAAGVDPTSSSSTPAASSSSSGLTGGAIAGIVIGVIVGVVIIIALLTVYLRSAKNKGGSDGASGASHKHVEMSEVREEDASDEHEAESA